MARGRRGCEGRRGSDAGDAIALVHGIVEIEGGEGLREPLAKGSGAAPGSRGVEDLKAQAKIDASTKLVEVIIDDAPLRLVEMKFSEARSSMSWLCRCFSHSIRSWISESMVSRRVRLQAVTESMAGAGGGDGNSKGVAKKKKAVAPPRGRGIVRDHPWHRAARQGSGREGRRG